MLDGFILNGLGSMRFGRLDHLSPVCLVFGARMLKGSGQAIIG
jgi:hypothetical protein